MNILITGANGFIGSNLTKLLVSEKHNVKAMVLQGTSLNNLAGIECEIIYADVSKPEMLQNIMNGIDVVYHLAAIPSIGWSKKIFNVNYYGTKNLIDEAIKSGVKRFVFMSSLVVHGFKNFVNADENTPLLKPGLLTRPYIRSKIRCEQMLEKYKNKIETVIIRPAFNIFGPNDMLSTYEIIRRLDNKQIMGYVGKGDKKLGSVYVENLAFGLYCAGVHPNAAGKTYIISDTTPDYVTLNNMFKTWSEKLQISPKIFSAPSKLLLFVGFLIDCVHFSILRNTMPLLSTYTVNSSSYDLHFSCEKAIKEIGYTQKVNFDDAIEKTWQWYKNIKGKKE